jgi:hypothetical protein
MVDRLAQQYPAIHAKVVDLPVSEQNRLAIAIAEHVLDAVNETDRPADRASAQASVTKLDELAMDAQDSDERSGQEYGELFSRARAMSAWLLASFDGAPTEAIYESLASADNSADIEALIDRA